MNKESRKNLITAIVVLSWIYGLFSTFGIACFSIRLSPADIQDLTQKIFHNECGQNYDKLIFWNPKETFPSLGIGHFIWVPSKQDTIFTQTFPDLLNYLACKGVKLPTWLDDHKNCPWSRRDEFLSPNSAQQRHELYVLLKNNLHLQTEFMVHRLQQKLEYIIQDLHKPVGQKVERNVALMAESKNGVYALIDYLNFKGDGLNLREHYNGYYWGLKQVLAEMSPCSTNKEAIHEFIRAAQLLLSQRIAHAPRNESSWRTGWFNRLETYRNC